MKAVFSTDVVKTIKEHIENNKGSKGDYVKNRDKALKDLKNFIKARHPDEAEFSAEQLRRKTEKIATREFKVRQVELFEEGPLSLGIHRYERGSALLKCSVY